MKRAAPLQVVASHGRRHAHVSAAPATIVVTTDPALFRSRFEHQLGQSVFLFDDGEAALRKLHESSGHVSMFLADFRALADRWTGQKFLKYIRDRREFDAVKVYLMADQWQTPQEQWIIKCGADGFIRRQPEHVARCVMGPSEGAPAPIGSTVSADAQVTAAGDPWMEEVNSVFKRFAGALGAKLLTMQALEAMESRGQGDRHFYVADLSSRLMNPGRRSEFLTALKQAGLID